ncbi:MAG: DMT family transporter [Chloroflexota bacterium]
MTMISLAKPKQSITQTPWFSWSMAIYTMLAFSSITPLARAAIGLGMNPTTILFLRYSIATVLFGLILGLTAKKHFFLDRRGLVICVVSGLFGGATTLTYYWALTRLSASIAAMLVSFYPLLVLVLLSLRGEKINKRQKLRLILGLGGVYLIIGPHGHVDFIGIVLIMTTALLYALQLVFIQWYIKDYDARATTFYMSVGGLITVTIFWLIQGVPWANPETMGWVYIGAITIFGTVLVRLAMFMAIRGIGSGQVALLAPPETLLAVTWSILFLQETLSLLQWLGSALIIFSALLTLQRAQK